MRMDAWIDPDTEPGDVFLYLRLGDRVHMDVTVAGAAELIALIQMAAAKAGLAAALTAAVDQETRSIALSENGWS